ncbi:hypothetical protein IB254_02020 [Pseudomonas sp. PDM03]|uniref:hypothetical protein n=1 Tax=Pseudomonas sp. PDM03 TaxID=2769266 RepID=UPI00177F2FF4|nr:hypothetical protein [Pseudomonas sp. PDM03]MBD9585822.1 hypothetical protein [Pseudomonas sp. PDM03]
MSNKNIWYLPGPFHQYQEDVKALAKEAGLRIIDANVTDDRGDEAVDTPEVTLKEVEQHLVLVVGDGDNKAELEELIGKLRIESDMVRAVIVGLEAGEIEKPECGELAIRLYQALEHIREKVDELATSRDALATDNETLRNELAELKAGEGMEVEALKVKLDAAGVTYRANASKESLEKLVADLPKA